MREGFEQNLPDSITKPEDAEAVSGGEFKIIPKRVADLDRWASKKEEDKKESEVKNEEPKLPKVENDPQETKKTLYQETKERLKQEQKELSRGVIKEAKRKREELLEARGAFMMSKSDFDTYFSGSFEVGADLKQGNTGDCYAVAAIHALSRSPNFELICRSSMQRMTDGSWQVKFPLMNEYGKTITIKPEDILSQRNKRFLRKSERGKILPDLRMRLRPLKGKEGLRVLEAAYIKSKFGSVNRLAAEGGYSEEFLQKLCGDMFNRFAIESFRRGQKEGEFEYPGLKSLKEEPMAYLDHFLENFDPDVFVATVYTKGGGLRLKPGYRAKGTIKFLAKRHAYSVSNIDRQEKTITLVNPWDTSKSLKFTFDQFKENFSGLGAVRINNSKLLKKMGVIGQGGN